MKYLLICFFCSHAIVTGQTPPGSPGSQDSLGTWSASSLESYTSLLGVQQVPTSFEFQFYSNYAIATPIETKCIVSGTIQKKLVDFEYVRSTSRDTTSYHIRTYWSNNDTKCNNAACLTASLYVRDINTDEWNLVNYDSKLDVPKLAQRYVRVVRFNLEPENIREYYVTVTYTNPDGSSTVTTNSFTSATRIGDISIVRYIE